MLSHSDSVESQQRSPGYLTWQILILTASIFAVLQCCRPLFHLTDDNLTFLYPFFSEIGRHLLNGQSPWYSDCLFGGHYNLLRDAGYFCWHPFYLLTSLLAGTPFRLWILDIDALFLYLISAGGFVRLACFLRSEGLIQVADGWIVFCALSYTFSMIGLVTCASWLTFENNAGTLPWLALGILQKEWRWGLGLVALFSVHQILGGHLEALVPSSFFLTLFAGGVSIWRRSYLPVVCWMVGYAMAVVLVLPLLWPAMEGFLSTRRSEGLSPLDIQANLIPVGLFPTSLFFGTASSLNQALSSSIPVNGVYTITLAGCAASFSFLLGLGSRFKWSFLEGFSLSLAALVALFICCPASISHLMQHLPLVKSIRWPFRELVQFQFFLHLFILIRPISYPPQTQIMTAVASSVLFVVPILFYPVMPTFNQMTLDRRVLMSGEFDRYWDEVRPLLKPGDRYVNLYPPSMKMADSTTHSFSLLGGSNYAMLARITNGSGYSPTVPVEDIYLKTPPMFFGGSFSLEQKEELMQERPDLKFMALERESPLKVTLSSRDGPTVDLTTYFLKALTEADVKP